MRRPSPSEMVLPAALAALLGIAAGFQLAPLVKGAPAVPPAGLVALAPVTTPTTAAPVVAPPTSGAPATVAPTTVAPASVDAPAAGATATAAPPTTAPPTTAAPVAGPETGGLPLLVVGDASVAAGRAPRLHLGAVSSPARPTGWVQSYVSPGTQGVELMIVVDGDDPTWAAVGASDETAVTPARVQRISDGGPTRVVVERVGHRIAVSSVGLTDAEITAVVAGLAVRAPGTPGVDAADLPLGLRLVAQGPGALASTARYRLAWGDDTWLVELVVDRALPIVASPSATGTPSSSVLVRTVAGVAAVVYDASGTEGDDASLFTVVWCRADGVCATMTTRGIPLDRTLAIAASVRPASAAEAAPILHP